MLLSVRPRFADSILSGVKSAELRRQRPTVPPGTPVIIYATKPCAAVIGIARIDRVCEGTPSDLWAQYQGQMAIAHEEFALYLRDARVAYVMLLSEAKRLASPLSLENLREGSDFQPPRSYRYVNFATLRTLVNGHPGGSSLLSLVRQPDLI